MLNKNILMRREHKIFACFFSTNWILKSFTAHARKLTTEPTNQPTKSAVSHRYNLFIAHARIHELKTHWNTKKTKPSRLTIMYVSTNLIF